MAKFTSKVKEWLGFGDEYNDEYYDEYEEYPEYDDYESPYKEEAVEDKMIEEDKNSYDRIKRSNIVNIKENAQDRVKIIIHEPIHFDDAPAVLDDILSRKVAVLNLEMLELDKKRQIFDFVSGGIYSLDGKIQKVTKDIFVIAPNGIDIDGKIKDQIQSKGFYQL
ncbi:MAG: cell division protein SepF [Gallicola sp.]|uniref:cell division protein SepF n=1 Tax=Gallicola sp. Sow4_E12 TaxID=3438785 RepID=UPI0017AEE4EF|nr:cell division protein SepF [Gallicola sp.]